MGATIHEGKRRIDIDNFMMLGGRKLNDLK